MYLEMATALEERHRRTGEGGKSLGRGAGGRRSWTEAGGSAVSWESGPAGGGACWAGAPTLVGDGVETSRGRGAVPLEGAGMGPSCGSAWPGVSSCALEASAVHPTSSLSL